MTVGVPACADDTTTNVRAAMLTITDDDGVPLEPRYRQVPLVGESSGGFAWDGARFVLVEEGAEGTALLHAFDADGNFTVRSAPLPGPCADRSLRLVPVGDNDYVVAYVARNTTETVIARFSLEPL